jgi:hypothetical protein
MVNIEKLTEQAITGEYESHGDISEGECIIGFSFGQRVENGQIKPGLSNEDLAEFIKNLKTDKPLILQFEIADALGDTELPLFRITEHREKGKYLETSEVAEQTLEIMKAHQWKTAVLIAHPFHMPRVDAVSKKLGISTIVPSGLDIVRFDPKSAQEKTRNKDEWAKLEPVQIFKYVKQGLM